MIVSLSVIFLFDIYLAIDGYIAYRVYLFTISAAVVFNFFAA